MTISAKSEFDAENWLYHPMFPDEWDRHSL
jgi:hypothetical protein